MNSELQDRRKYLGGSDVASLFGVNKWRSLYELWEEKTAETLADPEIEPEREKIFRRGRKLEPWIIELLEEERGIHVVTKNVRYSDQEFPWMACQLDFEYVSDEGLANGEAKTVSPWASSEWGEQDTDEIPLSYALQTLWGLGITNRPHTLVAALIGADDLRVHLVKRDEDLIQEMRRRAYEFWTVNVAKKIPPEPVTRGDVQKALYKKQGFVSPGSPEVWRALKIINGAKDAIKKLKDLQDRQEMSVKLALYHEAEAMGLCEDHKGPQRFVINDVSGKKLATLSLESRAAYSVAASSFLVLRTK